MKVVMMVVLLASLMTQGCANEDKAMRVLAQQGYTEIRSLGWTMFGCSNSDEFSCGFEAKSPAGIRVTGVVCSGFFKGATIRLD